MPCNIETPFMESAKFPLGIRFVIAPKQSERRKRSASHTASSVKTLAAPFPIYNNGEIFSLAAVPDKTRRDGRDNKKYRNSSFFSPLNVGKTIWGFAVTKCRSVTTGGLPSSRSRVQSTVVKRFDTSAAAANLFRRDAAGHCFNTCAHLRIDTYGI